MDLKQRYSDFQERMESTAHRIGELQAKLFLNIFYLTMVPPAHLYLKITNRLHHRSTGFFKEPNEKPKEIEKHRKQF